MNLLITVDIKINYYEKVSKELMVWIDTKNLYALVEGLVYFVFDTDIFLFYFLDLRIIVTDDCIIAWNFKSYTRVCLHFYYTYIHTYILKNTFLIKVLT